MEDEEAAPSIEKADLTHGATYSEHEVLLFTRGNDEDDDEPRIGKYASGKISRKRKDFYRTQRSCGKVMLLHLSVILFRGGGVLFHHPCRQPPGQTLPCPMHAGIHTPPRAVHAGIRSTSGRYASYWNAFLFLDIVPSFVKINQHNFC